MRVYSCHIQSQLVTRAARSGNFKNYSPHGCARLIERANFPFYPRVSSSAAFFPINASTFFPLFPLYAYFIIFFLFGLQQTRHRDLHFSNSSRFSTFACALVLYRLASSRYRLTISFLEQTAYLRSSLGRNWPKPKICRDIFLSLVVPSRCSFSICHFCDDNHEIFKFQCNH